MDCIFCKIIGGSIPSKKLYEDDQVLAFYDINPQAPVHFLVIAKELSPVQIRLPRPTAGVVAHIFEVIAKLAAEQGLTSYRIINNCGKGAGQTVPHLHFHVLSGADLSEKLC